jgi:archaellum component FlaC
MTLTDILLIILVIAVIAFMLYYLLRGSKGGFDITRPIESRVDEYLDRRFEDLIERWSLVTQPKLHAFRERASQQLGSEENRLAGLKAYEQEMTTSLQQLEERLDALEKDLVQAGTKKS